jgi:NADH dehydrogenase (ubiquinone) Fe-S protein 3
MRKHFPLTGHSEVGYDETKKRVMTEYIELNQEFRYIDFASPWQKYNNESTDFLVSIKNDTII